MFQNRNKVRLFAVSILLIISYACNLPGPSTPIPVTGGTPSSPTDTPAPTAVQHTVIPISLPAERSNHAGDFDSSQTASDRQAAGGDRFTFGQYERPFNADTMDTYFPYLDIQDTLTYQDDTWIYGSLTLKRPEKPDVNYPLTGRYALELDMDVDGKGDWLVLVSGPSSTEWTTEGVEIWQDTNKDVGGTAPSYTDEHPSLGDGFETQIFGTGEESDNDMAWARVSPDDRYTVQIAVKRSIFGNTDRYMVGMWAGNDALNPAVFDFNDHMTHEQAGAASKGFEYFYPIKGLAELDASCRVAVGFQPTGNEPGLCKTLVPVVPGAPGVPSCPNSCDWGQEPYPDCSCWPG